MTPAIASALMPLMRGMDPEPHWTADKKNHSASLTEEGMDYVEEKMGLGNIADDPKIIHHINASVKAYALFEKNVEYVVRGQEVVIIDENTGRPMFGRRFSDGLHQALEAKEGVGIWGGKTTSQRKKMIAKKLKLTKQLL
jgi:preprotein translocase subunit SecA